ncbi:beta-L-arabinofuranosidase domain-containing protein [Kitasatospora sp. NPDC051170]|uniref:beta-L-arabinofuranosidase domain-containing protein n=1 Tax=Kitasatospora sp. NPDC051170 TaxID=3364056 RepID=UPI00379B39AB
MSTNEPSVHRRTPFPAGAGVAAIVASGGVHARTPPDARPDINGEAHPFELSEVGLTAGRWLDNQNRTLAYLRFLDMDRLLHTFRLNAGLSSSAQPCGGWEAPDIELRGHSGEGASSAMTAVNSGRSSGTSTLRARDQ